MTTQPKVFRFDQNELDTTSFELRRAGRRLPLARIPMDLLILLVENRGRLVSREQIAEHLWPEPASVDVEAGINAAIKRIRGVLNDDPRSPRYIETIIGRGYRFVGAIDEEPTQPPAAIAERPQLAPVPLTSDLLGPQAEPGKPGIFRSASWLAALAAILAIAAVSWYWRGSRAAEPEWKPSQLTTNDGENRVEAAAVSPDGKLVAFAGSEGVFLRSLSGGGIYPLKSPPSFQVNRIAWFSDQLRVLLSGFDEQTSRPEIWTVSVTGAAPALVRENARNGVPSPDGMRIAFTDGDDSEIWIARAAGDELERIIESRPQIRFPYILWANRGKRLAYQRRSYDPRRPPSPEGRRIESSYHWDFQSLDVASGKIANSISGVHFDSAEISADGEMFLLRTLAGSNGGVNGIWEVRTNPLTGDFLSKPRQVVSLATDFAAGLTVSADGKRLGAVVEQGQPDVYVGSLHEPGPTLDKIHRLTLDIKSDFPQAWTPDSRSVIFESDREGPFHLYRQELDRRTPAPLVGTEGEQIVPQVTPDGAWLLYAVLPKLDMALHQSLYRARFDGTQAAEVPLKHPLDEFRCPALGGGTCVLRETIGHDEFIFYALSPTEGMGRELAHAAWSPSLFGDWALSPDSSTVAIPSHEFGTPDIRLIPLKGSIPGRTPTTIRARGISRLWGLHWAVNGKGWYAEDKASEGSSLVYISETGVSHVLRKTTYNTWGIPSPDGQKLAFVDYTSNRNVWTWQRADSSQ